MGAHTPIPDFIQAGFGVRSVTSRVAASEAVKFFKDCFVKGGFTDTSFQPWPKSDKVLGGGKRTLRSSGVLMQSIRKKTESKQRVVVESRLPYSNIHNEGGYITVTEKFKKFWWAKYAEIAKVPKKANGKGDWKKARNTKKARFCRAMAMKPLGSKIKIPKRQFMGNSRALMNQIEAEIPKIAQQEMTKAFKAIKFRKF